jgi:5'-nucleotidase
LRTAAGSGILNAGGVFMRKVIMAVATLITAAAANAGQAALPHILVTNDDGIDAPGIAALVEAMRPDFRITVCAPATEQSAVGHGITYRTPVQVEERPASDGVRRYAISAQPATCVRIGLSALLATDPPVIVLSGINRGDNAGRSTWVSGTVAGAREGALFGLPGIAFSAQRPPGKEPDFAAAGRWARRVVQQLLAAGLPHPGELVKVDMPYPVAAARGVLITRVGLQPAIEERYQERPGPHGERLFVSVYLEPAHDAPGTDVEALVDGFIAVTPLSLDQTDFRRIPDLNGIAWPQPEPAVPTPAASAQ